MIAAIGVPLVHGDVEGIGSAMFSQAATRVVTNRLKDWTNTERPDESDNRSFPSGHASASFAAAATLHKRYGWKYGAPAYAVATFVGGARVAAHKHFVRDVFAGAALGTAGGWFLTRKQNEDVQWLPWASTSGAGVMVHSALLMPVRHCDLISRTSAFTLWQHRRATPSNDGKLRSDS